MVVQLTHIAVKSPTPIPFPLYIYMVKRIVAWTKQGYKKAEHWTIQFKSEFLLVVSEASQKIWDLSVEWQCRPLQYQKPGYATATLGVAITSQATSRHNYDSQPVSFTYHKYCTCTFCIIKMSVIYIYMQCTIFYYKEPIYNTHKPLLLCQTIDNIYIYLT